MEMYYVVGLAMLEMAIIGLIFILSKRPREKEDVTKNNVYDDTLSKILGKQEDLFNNVKNEIKDLKDDINKNLKNEFDPLLKTTNHLNNILSNNQLRGYFGEFNAENLLNSAGFVKGKDYVIQECLGTTGKKPDITIFLSDKTKINVDVKFPFTAINQYDKTEDAEERKRHLNDLKKIIKEEVRSVKDRDYISLEENTVDFAIIFIANDKIFSFICEQCLEAYEYAMKNKVLMCGPVSFVAILMMIRKSYDSFRYQANLHQIINNIHEFENEYSKFKDCIKAIGDTISKLSEEYKYLAETRDKKLTTIVAKIKNDDLSLNLKK
jgi:DNA recombination protein RmuC